MSDYPRAVVREVDGQLVLDDPDARGVIRAVERENVRRQLSEHREMKERLQHFAARIRDPHGDDGTRLLVVVLCVDDHNGAALAEVLMPGHDWDPIRASGEVPFARGLADRALFQQLLDEVAPEAGRELREIEGVSVLAADRGVIAAFAAGELLA